MSPHLPSRMARRVRLIETLAFGAALALPCTPAAAQLWGAQPHQPPPRSAPQQPFNPFGGFFQQPMWRGPTAQPPRRTVRPSSRAQLGDFSKAPPPGPAKASAKIRVLVIGDSMAGWLAHGLESAYAEDPDVAVLRNARTNSGLIRRGPRSRFNDWIATAPELVAEAKPDFVVVMLGLSDRVPLRETAGEHARASEANNLRAQTNPKSSAAKSSAAKAANHQFRSQRWRQLYTKRVDDMIAVLKGNGVPVLWAGIPPIRGPRSRDDLAFLNDIYRASAQNAGIPYVDMWDGFTDENGKFSIRGPDHIGQIRRLRSPDGVYFTTAGARKLGHYVERELERVIAARASALAHGGAEPRQGGPVRSGGPEARPAAGPVIPLTSLNTSAERLAGSRSGAESSPDALARRVFVSGKALPAVSGRADDFGWPRRRNGPLATIPPAAAQTGRTVPRSPLNGR